MSSENSETVEYIAYEKIKKYSPVFYFYCKINNKNYVYVSQNLINLDNGNPFCIGVCMNNVKKNESAIISTNGSVKIRYFGQPIENEKLTNIYLASRFNTIKLIGISTQLNTEIKPYTYSGAFLIKLGSILQQKNIDKCKGNKERIITIQLDINNQNYDLYNIYLLSKLPKNKLDGQPFSFYDIGVDLEKGIINPLVKIKYQEVIAAYSSNQDVNTICFVLDQYCKELFKQIPEPIFNNYRKRLAASNSSGQVIYDSDYETLGIYNYDTNSAYKIVLSSNPFNINNFLVFATLINSALLSFIDPDIPENNNFIQSSFTYPAGSLYEIAQANINGVGVASRYAVSNQSYNYNVALFIGLTNSFNLNNGDSINVRLSWKKISSQS
jgi:hypothetical protein